MRDGGRFEALVPCLVDLCRSAGRPETVTGSPKGPSLEPCKVRSKGPEGLLLRRGAKGLALTPTALDSFSQHGPSLKGLSLLLLAAQSSLSKAESEALSTSQWGFCPRFRLHLR